MAIETSVLTLNDTVSWNDFIDKLPVEQKDVYYRPDYFALYEKYELGEAQCFVLQDDDNLAVYPYLKRSVNSLGYGLDKEYYDIEGVYGYNGVLTSNKSEEFMSVFYKHFMKNCSDNNIIAEFTRFNPYLCNQDLAIDYWNTSLNRKTVLLDINKEYEEIFMNSYSSKNRNVIRKARKNGLSFTIDNSFKAILEFLEIYQYTMKSINAESYYYFNLEYMKGIAEMKGVYFAFVKNAEGITLAGTILMIDNNYGHYHLSGRSEKCRDNTVSNFMLDESIKFCKTKKAIKFHLGGGNSIEENDTLFKFKKNFSKTHLDFFIGKKIHNEEVYSRVIELWENKRASNRDITKSFLLRYRLVD